MDIFFTPPPPSNCLQKRRPLLLERSTMSTTTRIPPSGGGGDILHRNFLCFTPPFQFYVDFGIVSFHKFSNFLSLSNYIPPPQMGATSLSIPTCISLSLRPLSSFSSGGGSGSECCWWGYILRLFIIILCYGSIRNLTVTIPAWPCSFFECRPACRMG